MHRRYRKIYIFLDLSPIYRLDTSYTKIDFESWDKQQEVDLVGHRDDSSHGHENSSSTAPIEQKPTVDSKDNVVGLRKCWLFPL